MKAMRLPDSRVDQLLAVEVSCCSSVRALRLTACRRGSSN